MSFIKYNSIIHNSNKNLIESILKHNKDLLECEFIVQHKYDGANFQVIFSKNSTDIKFASRNQVLNENSNFFNYKKIISLDYYQDIFKRIQDYLNNSKYIESINLFGELIGDHINKRVKYGTQSEYGLIFFDVYFNTTLQSPKTFTLWADNLALPRVETYMIEKLDACLKYPLSIVKTQTGDQIEGIVIKPYEKEYQIEDVCFFIKIKNEKFEEINEDKNENVRVYDDKSRQIVDFKSYISVNRVLSTFGKQEWNKKEISRLVHEVIIDAFNDFKLNFPEFSSNIDLETLKISYYKYTLTLVRSKKLF